MTRTTLEAVEDCQDLLEGALWMGTGGGGSLSEGLSLLENALAEGLCLEFTDANSIPDHVWTATVGLHGSIAPPTAETLAEIDRLGLTEATREWYIARAVRELGDYLGHEFGCLVPGELGPGSVAIPLVAGARLGISVVDGDYIGRAVPEELQATYCLYGKQSDMLAGVDVWGNVCIVKETVNTHALERIAKMLALAAYGDVAVATTPLLATEMKEIVVPGTLSLCLKIGRTLRTARDAGLDPVDATLDMIGGWRLFDGTVACLETDNRDGYLYGTTHIQGTGNSQGQRLEVWFKNENQVSWLNGSPWVCSPDLVSLVHQDCGRGIYNAELREGDHVAAIGLQGVESFRTEKGLELAGPRHFGFDIDYVPIEELMVKGGSG